MADTKRDDPDACLGAYSIAGEGSHEMRALPVAAQIARREEHLPAIPVLGMGRGENGGETRDMARSSTLQTKGPSDDDGTKYGSDLANVVVRQGLEEDEAQGDITAAPTPIIGQGPPSFAQSEFYTVNLISIPPLILSSLISRASRLSVVNAVNAAAIISI
jgi:hypothetical protein